MDTDMSHDVYHAVKFLPGNRWCVGAFDGVLSLLSLNHSSSSIDDNKTPNTERSGGSTGDPARVIGAFQVRSQPATSSAGSTSVVGKIYGGPTPSQVVWEVQAEEGGCQLLTPRIPFCDEPCGGSAACVGDDERPDGQTCQSDLTCQ